MDQYWSKKLPEMKSKNMFFFLQDFSFFFEINKKRLEGKGHSHILDNIGIIQAKIQFQEHLGKIGVENCQINVKKILS